MILIVGRLALLLGVIFGTFLAASAAATRTVWDSTFDIYDNLLGRACKTCGATERKQHKTLAKLGLWAHAKLGWNK